MGAPIGLELLSALLQEKTPANVLNLGLDDDFFLKSEVALYQFIRTHIQKHGAVPSINTVLETFSEQELPQTEEPSTYYAERVRERFTHKTLSDGMNKARQYLNQQSEEYNPNEALDILMDTTTETVFKQRKAQIIDFRKAKEIIESDYVLKEMGQSPGIDMGWPTLDEMTGGLMAGDMVSFVGRPAAGKTFMLLNALRNAWLADNPVMMISMEMTPLPLVQRLAAMQAHLGLTGVKNANLPKPSRHKLFTELQLISQKESPCWIVDGNLTTTVEDIWSLCRQLQPAALYIDGAYLIQVPGERGEWAKVTSAAKDIKRSLATDMGIPVICSYQFNREAAKKIKKQEDKEVGLEDIGYTDAVGQLSSVVLGMFEQESVEQLQKRKISILKGRSGEVGEFEIFWDFDNMRFDEYHESEVDALENP